MSIFNGHKLLVTRMNNFGDLMYSPMTINNLWLKLTRRVDLKSCHHKFKKMYVMEVFVNYPYYSNHFAVQMCINSLCCRSYAVLYISYIKKKLRGWGGAQS